MTSKLKLCLFMLVGSMMPGGCDTVCILPGNDNAEEDDAVSALVGTWLTEDGQVRLKVDQDGTAVVEHLQGPCWTGCAGGIRVEESDPGLFLLLGQLIESGGDAGPPMTFLSAVLDGDTLVYTFELQGSSGVIFCSETFELTLGESSDLTCP